MVNTRYAVLMQSTKGERQAYAVSIHDTREQAERAAQWLNNAGYVYWRAVVAPVQ